MPKIEVDKEKCIGCGTCVEICENFRLVEGKSKPIDPNPKKIGCNKRAKDNCPTGAISIK